MFINYKHLKNEEHNLIYYLKKQKTILTKMNFVFLINKIVAELFVDIINSIAEIILL